jgi:hypothetical protein
MERPARTVLLQSKHARPFGCQRIILHDRCLFQPSQDVAEQYIIGCQFVVPMVGDANITLRREGSDAV